MSTGTAPGRVVCPRCGANNFNTQAACWKCGSALSSNGPASYAATPTSPRLSNPGMAPDMANGLPVAPAPVFPDRPVNTVDPAVAVWSAILLAFLMPFVAVPVGFVFLMLDDRRKGEIGRITLIWGILFSIVQCIATGILFKGPIDLLKGLAGMAGGARMSSPKLSDPVANPFPSP